MAELVRLSRDDGVATVTVNRPEKRNAMDIDTRVQLRETLERVEDDGACTVLVIRGAGDDAFIAGGDLGQMAEYGSIEGLSYLTTHAQGLYTYVAEMATTTVAAIDGYAFGGGLELALACDLRVASASATLGLPEAGVGLLPGGGGTQRLTHIAGVGVAKDLILTGRAVDAPEALDLGVVTRVYDDDDFESELDGLTDTLLESAPLSRQLAKTAIDAGRDDAGFAVERLAGALLFDTDDFAEGTDAFKDGRNPEFDGR